MRLKGLTLCTNRKVNIIALVMPVLLLSCNSHQTVNQTKIELHPLNPVSYEFKDPTPQGKLLLDRADFFYIDVDTYLTKAQRKELFEIVSAQKNKIKGNYNALSIYVYKKTDKLNPAYRGSFQDIKGVYDNDLLSYTRWMNGRMDIFYIIKDGNVVYDMIEKTDVMPKFEFN